MFSSRSLRVAAGLALTVAGGVSALFLTIGPISSSSAETIDQTSTDGQMVADDTGVISGDQSVIVEYVDQFGNPIDPDRITSANPDISGTSDASSGVAGQPRYHDDDDRYEHEDDDRYEHEDDDRYEHDDDDRYEHEDDDD